MPNDNLLFKILKISSNLDLENTIVQDAKNLQQKVFVEEEKTNLVRVFDDVEKNLLLNVTFIVAYLVTKENKLVPIATIRTHITKEKNKKIGNIAKFCILKKYRAESSERIKGLAKELGRCAENQLILEKVDVLHITAVPKAINFYKLMGYKQYGWEVIVPNWLIGNALMKKLPPSQLNTIKFLCEEQTKVFAKEKKCINSELENKPAKINLTIPQEINSSKLKLVSKL